MPAPKDGSPIAATKPQAPTAAKDAADAVAGSSTDPTSGSNSKSGASASTAVPPKHDPNSDENKDKKSWIGVQLVYESNGQPVVGMPYEVTLPDGTTVSSGSTDSQGQARVDGIDPGSCQISFPTLDKEAWAAA